MHYDDWLLEGSEPEYIPQPETSRRISGWTAKLLDDELTLTSSELEPDYDEDALKDDICAAYRLPSGWTWKFFTDRASDYDCYVVVYRIVVCEEYSIFDEYSNDWK